jgi:predicted O-methyltransferase YrrM
MCTKREFILQIPAISRMMVAVPNHDPWNVPMSVLRNQLFPWIKVLACQAVAFLAIALLAGWLSWPAMVPGGPGGLLAQGVLAAILGHFLKLPRIWLLVQVMMPMAVVHGDVVPAWAYLFAFVVCALVYWNSASEQVPLYLTNRRTWQALGDLVAANEARTVADLGSGMGGVVTFLARAYPNAVVSGLETAPLVVAASKLRVLLSRLPNARIVYRSLWDEPLGAYDLVYCFLSPVPMPRLYAKARAEMRPGSLFVTNSFPVPGRAADRILDVDDGRRTQLHIYAM